MAAEEIRKDAELEDRKLDEDQTEKAAGGWLRDEPRHRDEIFYKQYGIIYIHHYWSRDEYYIYNVKISEGQADKIIDKTNEVGHILTKEELAQYFGIQC